MVDPINWREPDLAVYRYLCVSDLYLHKNLGIGFEVVDGGAGAARCIGK